MTIVNWTPHEVCIYDADLCLRTKFPPSGYAPRLAETRTMIDMADGVLITRVDRSKLTEPLRVVEAGVTAVIVNETVAPAVKAALEAQGRGDVRLLAPDTGPGYAVRRAADGTLSARPDATGQVVGCLALRRVD